MRFHLRKFFLTSSICLFILFFLFNYGFIETPSLLLFGDSHGDHHLHHHRNEKLLVQENFINPDLFEMKLKKEKMEAEKNNNTMQIGAPMHVQPPVEQNGGTNNVRRILAYDAGGFGAVNRG